MMNGLCWSVECVVIVMLGGTRAEVESDVWVQ